MSTKKRSPVMAKKTTKKATKRAARPRGEGVHKLLPDTVPAPQTKTVVRPADAVAKPLTGTCSVHLLFTHRESDSADVQRHISQTIEALAQNGYKCVKKVVDWA